MQKCCEPEQNQLEFDLRAEVELPETDDFEKDMEEINKRLDNCTYEEYEELFFGRAI